MLETGTKLKLAILASLNASSKLASFSLCLPIPLVRNISLGTSFGKEYLFGYKRFVHFYFSTNSLM